MAVVDRSTIECHTITTTYLYNFLTDSLVSAVGSATGLFCTLNIMPTIYRLVEIPLPSYSIIVHFNTPTVPYPLASVYRSSKQAAGTAGGDGQWSLGRTKAELAGGRGHVRLHRRRNDVLPRKQIEPVTAKSVENKHTVLYGLTSSSVNMQTVAVQWEYRRKTNRDKVHGRKVSPAAVCDVAIYVFNCVIGERRPISVADWSTTGRRIADTIVPMARSRCRRHRRP